MPASRQSSTPAPTDLADFILPGYAATIGLSLLLALLSFPVWRETMEGFPHPSVSMEEDGPRLVRALYFQVAAAAAAPTTAAADGGAGVADESEQEGGGSAIPNPDVFSDDPPERVNWRFKLMVLDYVAHDLPKILRWAVLALILDQVILHTIPNLPSYRAIVVFLFSPKRPRRLMKRLPGLLRLCVFFLFLMRVNVHATVKHVQRLILIWLAPRDTVNPDAVLGDRRFLGEGRQVREYSPSQRVKRWAVEERERVRTERAERVARLAGGGGGGERGRDSGGGVGGGDGLDGARSSAGVADGADGANGADGQSIADAVHRQRQLRGLDNSH
ncbi:hypothetical protein DFJ73DRAFT_870591 [Zopfochytrium polystomum]|nr:hypothetical protein DFJ73DRAFT_870591 [Zopfochytrium polystomum]